MIKTHIIIHIAFYLNIFLFTKQSKISFLLIFDIFIE